VSGEPGDAGAKVLPFRLTERTMRRRREAEGRRLYRVTAGFSDPDLLAQETRQMFLEGWELP
jgi:hypothetical protein